MLICDQLKYHHLKYSKLKISSAKILSIQISAAKIFSHLQFKYLLLKYLQNNKLFSRKVFVLLFCYLQFLDIEKTSILNISRNFFLIKSKTLKCRSKNQTKNYFKNNQIKQDTFNSLLRLISIKPYLQ